MLPYFYNEREGKEGMGREEGAEGRGERGEKRRGRGEERRGFVISDFVFISCILHLFFFNLKMKS